MVSVEQWSPRWAKVSNLQKLGVNFELGNEAMLGERIFDRSGKILVVLQLTDKNVFEKYLPGSENISRIKQIVQLFLSQPLAFDIEVCFTPADLIQVVLGKNTAPLGISSSCGTAVDQAEGYSITIPGRE
jgi:type VI secretion system protein ImpH